MVTAEGDWQRYLDLLKWHFKCERFVVVRVERALLDRCLLLLEALGALVESDLHVRI